jgi:hypothetical protein
MAITLLFSCRVVQKKKYRLNCAAIVEYLHGKEGNKIGKMVELEN